KVASNTPLFERLSRDMDFNAGRIADGTAEIDELGDELFELVLDTASGRKTWSETHGYGDDEFVLWDTGPMT
ncbi:MAG: altronate dehydratase, partial [Planctomycetota bacterium]